MYIDYIDLIKQNYFTMFETMLSIQLDDIKTYCYGFADIDECSTGDPCQVQKYATCTNEPGYYTCVCQAGYVPWSDDSWEGCKGG